MTEPSQQPQAADPHKPSTPKPRAPRPRTMRGIVISDKMSKTVVVEVSRKVRHPLYEKFVNKRTRLHAHDEKDEAKEGDTVEVALTRRLSKNKTWRLVRVVQKAVR